MNEIKAAFRDTIEEKVLIAVPEGDEPIFSARFERRMKRLSKSTTADHVPIKRAAVLSLVVAVGFVTMTLPTVGNQQSDIILTERAGYSELYFAKSDASRERIDYVYEFDVPEGFELYRERTSKMHRMADYKRADERLIINQYSKDGFGGHISSEDSEIVETIVNGCGGFYVEQEEYRLLAWDNGDYFLELAGTLSLEELRDVAGSISRRDLTEEELKATTPKQGETIEG